MKKRLFTSLSRPRAQRPSRRWTCQRCLVEPTTRSITSTSSKKATIQTDTATTSSYPPSPPPPSSREKHRGFRKISIATESSNPPAAPASDRYRDLKSIILPHRVPPQLLVHITPEALRKEEREQRKHLFRWAMAGHVDGDFNPKAETARQIKGVVVRAGKMDKTVKVRIPGQRYDTRVKKYFASFTNHLTHDPNNSLREGDVVILHKLHVSKQVKHVVASIEVPFEIPLDQRPPIPSPEERLQTYKEQRIKRLDFRMLRVQAVAGSKAAQTQMLGRKQDPRRKLTESTILQAANYAKLWSLRRNGKRVPPLRKYVKPRVSKEAKLSHADPKGNPAWKDSQAVIAEKKKIERNAQVSAAKTADLSRRGLQVPSSS